MSNFTVLLLTIAAIAATSSSFADDTPESCSEGLYVPQPDDSLKWMCQGELQSLVSEQEPQPRGALSGFYLYTKQNPDKPQRLALDDETALHDSNFDSARPTRMLIHGYLGNYSDEINREVRSAFMDTGDYNIISVDYSSYAPILLYPISAKDTPDIGKQVAEFLDFLNTKAGMPFKTLKLVGHSLGGQISGYASKNVKNGRIPQITALDPAMPLFSLLPESQRLNADDAIYVESIQTNGGQFGFLRPIGTATFYPNGGVRQPGCGLGIICSHSRSYKFYAEAIRHNNFPSIQCATTIQAHSNTCGKNYSSVRLGAPTNMEDGVQGIFYVPVNAEPPYGMG